MPKRVILTSKLALMGLFFGKLCRRAHTDCNPKTIALAALVVACAACTRTTAPRPSPPPAPPTALGVPLYPGAAADPGGSFTAMRGATATSLAAFLTHDPFARVVTFYQKQLPAGSQTLSASTADGLAATFEFARPHLHLTVEIASSKPDETDVLIKRVRTTGSVGN